MKTTTIFVLVIVLLLALGGGGWYVLSPGAVDTLPAQVIVANAPSYSIEVAPSQSGINVNDTVRLHFTARKNGQVQDIYNEEKVVHYVIASANYQDFYHTFSPEEVSAGKFYIDHTFTQPGAYRVWTELVDTTKGRELHHGNNAALISYVELNVTGDPASPGTVPVRAQQALAGPYRVINNHAPLAAGKPATLRVHVEDQQGTILPVFPEEPAIYVMVGPDFNFFRHTHAQPAVNGKYIELTETFPTAGEYLFWTEIYVQNGETYDRVQIPFLITVV